MYIKIKNKIRVSDLFFINVERKNRDLGTQWLIMLAR
jgi:hypothetical protein